MTRCRARADDPREVVGRVDVDRAVGPVDHGEIGVRREDALRAGVAAEDEQGGEVVAREEGGRSERVGIAARDDGRSGAVGAGDGSITAASSAG